MHDQIHKIKSELLESIWNGFHLHRFGEQPPGEPPYTPIRIPVFSERDSVTTVILIGGYAWIVADEFDAPFSDRDREVLVTFERFAADPEIRVSFHSSNAGRRSCSTTARCCTTAPRSRTTTSRT